MISHRTEFVIAAVIGGVVVVAVAGGLVAKFLFKSKPQVALEGSSIKIAIRLVDKEVISHDSNLYTFALPNKEHILGLPLGNCVCLHARLGGENVLRPYTPISRQDLKGYVKFLIKTYRKNVDPRFPNGGKMSQHLESLQNDDYVEMSGPLGRISYKGDGLFEISGQTIKELKVKCITMICGGSGITPMYQLIQAILNSKDDMTKIALLYANRTEKDILLRDELESLRDSNRDQFRVWYTVGSPGTNWAYSVGNVDRNMIEQHTYPAGDSVVALLCGPKPMIDLAATPNLVAIGYQKEKILVF